MNSEIADAAFIFDRDGFLVLNDLTPRLTLDRFKQAAHRLQSMASNLLQSNDNFVLEAAHGGWVAWQQGDPAFKGLLRTVRDAQLFTPDLVAIAESLLLGAIVRQLTGAPEVSLITVFLWAKPERVGSAKPWHQDMAFAPPGFEEQHGSVITIWIAIDDAAPQNGCLEFVPGSHKLGVLVHEGTPEHTSDQPRSNMAVEPHVDIEPIFGAACATACAPLRAGSAVVFDGKVLHRSVANRSGTSRRAFSFVYARPFADP
jgi:ectoine hydroxylase-related dioxygenase (phytanoyl-CoA dioxygenase family)